MPLNIIVNSTEIIQEVQTDDLLGLEGTVVMGPTDAGMGAVRDSTALTAIQPGPLVELPTVFADLPLHDSQQQDGACRDCDGWPIDLNVGCELSEPVVEHADPQASLARGSTSRSVLGQADHRLNKGEKDHQKHKTAARGVSRYAIPFKKSLLCNPMIKPKSVHAKAMPQTWGK